MGLVLRTALVIAGNLGFGGALVGLVSAVLALWLGDDLAGAALIVTRGYWGLLIVLPVLLWFAHLILPDFREPTGFPGESCLLYLSLPAGIVTSILGTLLGVGLGGGPFFLVLGANLPVLFGGYEADAFYDAISPVIYWRQFAIVAVVALLSALPMAFWVHQKAKEWY